MPKKFQELLNDTFDNGTVHIKYLEQIIKCISTKLNLSEMEVEYIFECQNSTKNDPLAKLISPLVNSGSNNKENSIVDIIQLLNISKRMEALEISVQKISSVMHSIMTNERIEKAKNEPIETFAYHNDVHESDLHSSTTNSLNTEESVVDEIKFDMNKLYEDKLSSLEEILAKQDCILVSLINQNEDCQNQICETQKYIKCVEEKLKDVFYACEQNDEKIDEAIFSINDCNSDIFCLKPNVNKLLKDSDELSEKFNQLSDTCEQLNVLKADQSYVDDIVLNKFERITASLKEITKFEEYRKEEYCIEIKMKEIEESFKKFQDDFKTALLFIKSLMGEKLEKKAIKDFKGGMQKKFDDFLDELKNFLVQFSSQRFANGTTKAAVHDLKCISCRCNVCMKSNLEESKFLANFQNNIQKNVSPAQKKKKEKKIL